MDCTTIDNGVLFASHSGVLYGQEMVDPPLMRIGLNIVNPSVMPSSKTALERLKNSWWFAWVVALILALTHAKDAVDGIDKLLVLAKVKPDALYLAQSAEKGEFSRALTEAAWKRLFWARAFKVRVERGAPAVEVDEAWKAYISASEVWSTRIMVFIVTTEKFYGVDKSSELEGVVQATFGEMANALASVRYAKNPDAALLMVANDKIDAANVALYHFVRGVAEKRA